MKFVKVASQHLHGDASQLNKSTEKSSNFLLTMFISTVGCVFVLWYVIFNIPPNTQWIILVLILIGYVVAVLSSIVMYAFAKRRGFESDKEMYRRQFKKGAIVGVLVIVFMAIQWQFNFI